MISTTKYEDCLHIDVTLRGEERQTKLKALVDSGATMTFLNEEFARKKKMRLYKYERPIPLFNVDGTRNQAGPITHYTWLWVKVGDHETKERIPIHQENITGFLEISSLFWTFLAVSRQP